MKALRLVSSLRRRLGRGGLAADLEPGRLNRPAETDPK